MNNGKKWIVAAVCLVFIAGLFAGIVFERRLLHRHASDKWRSGEKHRRRQEPLDRITKDLSLNKEQSAKVGKIFEKHRPEFETLHKEFKGDLRQLMDIIDKEIITVLDAEQKKKYILLAKEREKRFSKRDDRGMRGFGDKR